MKRVVVLSGLALLAGCASSPKDVKPTYVPDTVYASMDCQQLGQEELKEGDVLEGLTNKQRRAHKTDTWGVLALGVPLSEMTGSDVAGVLAREKGKMEAIQRMQVAKSCPGAGVATVPATLD